MHGRGRPCVLFPVPGYDGSISPTLLALALGGELWFALWLLLEDASRTRTARGAQGNGELA